MTDPEDWERLSCDTRCQEAYCVALRNDSLRPGMAAEWCLVVTDRQGTVTGSLTLTETEDPKVTRASEAGVIDVRGWGEARRTFMLRSKRQKDGSLVEMARTLGRTPQATPTPIPKPRQKAEARFLRCETEGGSKAVDSWAAAIERAGAAPVTSLKVP
ncbi:hypothetical protein ACN469_43300 [Corallococcus terminator]